MAWRIDKAVARGEIDNRTPGEVTGQIWFAGLDNPVMLSLKGDCHRDLAGCRLTFTNPDPRPDDRLEDLQLLQEGVVGDITAARKVRIPAISQEEHPRRREEGNPVPTRLANSLYLEWFSETNGRVVIESASFHCQISEHTWTMTPEGEAEQRRANGEAMSGFLDQIFEEDPLAAEEECADDVEANTPWSEDEEDGMPWEEDDHAPGEAFGMPDEDEGETEPPFDEFEAERFLQECDRRTDRYLELLDKYQDEPGQESVPARARSWEDGTEHWEEEPSGAGEDPEENVERRGIKENQSLSSQAQDPAGHDDDLFDISDDDFAVRDHPLCRRVRDLSLQLTREADVYGFKDETNRAHPVIRLLNGVGSAGAKLAGALNGLEVDETPLEPGLTVAWLKRALHFLHEGLAGTALALEQRIAPRSWLLNTRQELLCIRGDILEHMEKYRRMIR
jgi:hypothetical protein